MTSTLPRVRRKGPALLGLLLAVNVVAFSAVATTGAASAAVATSPNLGSALSASVLGASTVTNTGSSVLVRNLDLSPGTSVTGFPPGLVGGVQHVADGPAAQAQSDATAAYLIAQSAPTTQSETGVDLAGQTLQGGGVFTASTSMALTGRLVLAGDPSSVFIFQAGTTLTTGSGSSVVLTGGVEACNVWWQVGSSATLGTGTQFVGNVMALASVTVETGTTVDGRALAQTGAVTLDNNVFFNSPCAAPGGVVTPPTTPATTPATTAPPATTAATAPAGGTTATTQSTSALPSSPLAFTAADTTTTGPAVVGPPKTGGGPLRPPSSSPWLPVLIVSLIASAGMASGLGLRARRRIQHAGR